MDWMDIFVFVIRYAFLHRQILKINNLRKSVFSLLLKIFQKNNQLNPFFVAFFQIHTKNFHKNIFDNSITNTMCVYKTKSRCFLRNGFLLSAGDFACCFSQIPDMYFASS